MQQVGTANIDGPAGVVKVVASPVGSGGKWIQISRSSEQQSVSGFQGNFPNSLAMGPILFRRDVYAGGRWPGNHSVRTVWPAGEHTTSFMHIDFTQDNKVRIDDNDANKFGSFPRGQAFIVQVTLNINATASTAHIVLSGADASGTADYTVLPPFRSMAKAVWRVRLWMGFPWTGFLMQPIFLLRITCNNKMRRLY